MTLFQIDERIFECFDEETGEVFDIKKLAGLQLQREECIENLALAVKNLNAEAAAVKAEKDAFAKRQKSLENKVESLKKYLSTYLAGEKFKSPRVDISFRKSTKLVVEDMAEIPEQFFKYAAPTVDKSGLKAYIQSGESVPGCRLETSENIQIK